MRCHAQARSYSETERETPPLDLQGPLLLGKFPLKLFRPSGHLSIYVSIFPSHLSRHTPSIYPHKPTICQISICLPIYLSAHPFASSSILPLTYLPICAFTAPTHLSIHPPFTLLAIHLSSIYCMLMCPPTYSSAGHPHHPPPEARSHPSVDPYAIRSSPSPSVPSSSPHPTTA